MSEVIDTGDSLCIREGEREGRNKTRAIRGGSAKSEIATGDGKTAGGSEGV